MDQQRVRQESKAFARAMRQALEVEAQCLIGGGRECEPKVIEAHSIQRAKLKFIARNNKVLVMVSDEQKIGLSMTRSGLAPRWEDHFQYRSINNRLVKARLACGVHDNQIFASIEDGQLDPCNPDHCLLLAYRAVLLHLHKKRVAARALEILALKQPAFSLFHFLGDKMLHDRREAERIKAELDTHVLSEVRTAGSFQWQHDQIPIESEPTVAATAVMMVDGPGAAFTPRQLEEIRRLRIPRSPNVVPIIVTAYPEAGRQVAIVSFPKGRGRLARVIVPALGETNEARGAALLSKTLLEETENIMVSPSVWDSLTEDKRSRIFRQYIHTVPLPVPTSLPPDSPGLPEHIVSEIAHAHEPDFIDDCDPEEVSLFR